jgi:hypothetical protein
MPAFSTDDKTADDLWLYEWIVSVGCALHDTQSAFRWSLPHRFADADLLKDIWISMASVRQSYDAILRYLSDWIVTALSFTDKWADDEFATWKLLWETLRLDEETVNILMYLQLRFCDGRLLVSVGCRGDADLVQAISTIILVVWKFRRYTDSRWLSLGYSSTNLVAGEFLGLTAMLSFALTDCHVSGFFLNGFFRLARDDCWTFVVEACIVSHIPDCVLRMLMKDNRVGRNIHELADAMHSKFSWLRGLPDSIWNKLASISTVTGDTLKQNCILAGHRCVAFFHWRVVRPATQLPWTLVRGDIVQNLKDLAAGQCPNEPISAKAWKLMQLGESIVLLARMLTMLADTPWTSMVVEQLHGTMAALSRFHPEYSLDSLLTRSMIMFFNKLVYMPSKLDKDISSLGKAMQNIDRREPSKAGPRHAYVQDLMHQSKVKAALMSANERLLLHRKIIRLHGPIWEGKTARVKQLYKRLATVRASAARVKHSNKRAEVAACLAHKRETKEAEQRERAPLMLQAAAMTQRAVDRLPQAWAGTEYSRCDVERLRADCCSAPPLMSDTLEKALHELETPDPPGFAPRWLVDVTNRREAFQHTAWSYTVDGREQVVLFILAVQQPRYISFCRVERRESTMPWPSMTADWEPVYRAWSRHIFDVKWTDIFGAESLPPLDPKNVKVFWDLEYVSNTGYSSRHDPIPLDIFILESPVPDAVKEGDGEPSSRSSKPSTKRTMNPVLEKQALKHKLVSYSEGSHVAADDSESGSDADIDIDAETERRAWEELAEARAILDATDVPRFDDFRVVARGGESVMAKKGVGADCYTGKAQGLDVEDWCRRKGVCFSARFEISTFTAVRSQVMARTWCHKMQFYYNLAISSADPLRPFTAVERASWVPPTEFTRASAEMVGNVHCTRRVAYISNLFR